MDSPCVKLCVYDPAHAICAGCGRTLPEIANWAEFSEAERRAVLAELPGRLKRLRDGPVKTSS
jgi:uncharacterized protein